MSKNVLITGVDRGIGYAAAQYFAIHGYNICANYLNDEQSMKHLYSETKAADSVIITYKADISSISQISNMFNFFEDKVGSIDLLINNAGITEFVPFLDATENDWTKTMSIDFKGAYFCTQAAAKNMIKYKKNGLIINISSNHIFGCWPNASIYASAKSALEKFGKHAAMELAEYGIRVITFCPGYTDTGWGKKKEYECIKNKIPLKRFASPSEIAEMLYNISSDSFKYLTGCTITADGGALLGVIPENMFD